MKLSELKQIVDNALVLYGDIPVVENNDYWMRVVPPRHGSLEVGIPSMADLDKEYHYNTECFVIEVGC